MSQDLVVVFVINTNISGSSHPQLYKHVVQIVEKFVKKVSTTNQ